jgi:cytochrome c553
MLTKKLLITAIFALLLVTGAAQAGGDAEAGKALAANCSGCHGENGEGMDPNPPIAGLDEAAHVEMLKAYKDGTREDPMMQMFVASLSEEDMANLAAYYATLEK